MIKLPSSFSKEKVELLKNYYPSYSKEEVLKIFPDYKWRSLQNIANFLKIKRKFVSTRKGNIENLLNGTIESFYWLGFISADGCFNEDGTIKLELSIKDKDHLKNFAKFVCLSISEYPSYKSSLKNGKGSCRVKAKNIEVCTEIRSILNIKGSNHKTYHPISLKFLNTKEKFVSFLTGYIDGDGGVTKGKSIVIDGHKNIYPLFKEIEVLYRKYINNVDLKMIFYKDMVRICFGVNNSIRLKREVNNFNFQVMGRKWSVLSSEFPIKNVLLHNKNLIQQLRARNLKLKEICKIINYKSCGTLSTFCKQQGI